MKKNKMRRMFPYLLAGLLTLAGGCVSSRQTLILDPVGPGLVRGGFSSQGFLQVYSETGTHDDGHIPYYPHSSYTVYSPEGQFVKFVPNHIGINDQAATIVALPVGQYRVVARAAGFGRVTIPVVIAGGRTTLLYLERDGMPDTAGLPEQDYVRLPGGPIVGWRAQTPATGCGP